MKKSLTQLITNSTELASPPALPSYLRKYSYVLRIRMSHSSGRKWKRRRRGLSMAFLGTAQRFIDDEMA